MSKSLTLSMSLALALGFSGVSFAGHGDCATCGIASPQGTVASPQASAQGYETCDTCAPAKKHHFKLSMPSCLKPKPKTYSYEWVLKKKKVHAPKAAACDTCGTAVTPSAQYSSPQGVTYAAPQATYSPAAYGAPQAYGASQSVLPTSEVKPVPAGDAVPAAPAAPAPAAVAPPAPTGTQSSLLFLSPAGN